MFSRGRTRIRLAGLTLDQIRRLRPMPSGYETDRVFHLSKELSSHGITWQLEEVRLQRPLSKLYDRGIRAEWLESYADAGPSESLRFLGALQEGEVVGLATWTVTEWNATLWLVDIRVRPENRGSGVGSVLVDGLKERCREQELRGIFVETQIRNYPAVRFYRRCGFDIVGFNDHLYGNDDLTQQDVALFLFLEV